MAMLFGSAEAQRIRARDAETEHLDALPMRRWEVCGEITIEFSDVVEARTAEEARAEALHLVRATDYLPENEDCWFRQVQDLGLANPTDPEEQEKEMLRQQRESLKRIAPLPGL